MPKVEINGQVVEFASMPTPDDIDHVAGTLKPGAGTVGGAAVSAALGPQQRPSSWARPATQAAGAALGGALGARAGLGGAVTGALTGAGLGGTGFDIATGEIDPKRLGLQGLATAAFQSTATGREMSLAKSLLSSGFVSTLAGGAYDLGKSAVTGKFPEAKQKFRTMVSDFLGGTGGEVLARVGGKISEPRAAAREEALTGQAERRAAFARQGIPPRASEITQSPVVSALENIPEDVIVGRGRPVAFEKTRTAAAETAVRGKIGAISPKGITSPRWAGEVVQPALQEARAKAEASWGRAFDTAETVAGDAPFEPAHFVNALESVTSREPGFIKGAATGPARPVLQSITGPARDWQRYADRLQDLGLQPESAAAGAQALQAKNLSFTLARRFEKELGAIGFRGQPSMQTAQARYLYAALMKDMDAFFETETGQQVHPLMQAAKQEYKTGRAVFDESRLRGFLRTKEPEHIIKSAFEPGKVSVTDDLKMVLPDDVWNQAVQGWMEGLYQQAHSTTGVFDPFKFGKLIEKYERNGHLDHILGPAADDFRDAAKTFTTMRQSPVAPQKVMGTGTDPATGRRVLTGGQVGSIAPIAYMLLHGEIGPALATAGGAFGMPMALGQMTTRSGGINALTSLATPRAPMTMAQRRMMAEAAALGEPPR